MDNKNNDFLKVLIWTLVIYIGFTLLFPAKKAPTTQNQNPQAQEQLDNNTQKLNIQEAIVKEASPNTQEIKESDVKDYALDLEDAEVIFTTKGAAIKSYIYKDIIEPVDLTPYKGPGYFATLPNVNFELVSKDKNAISFKAELAKDFEVYKTYTFGEVGSLNNLSLKLVNKTGKALDISNLDINFGPGLNTVKSERGDNPSLWRAFCTVKPENRKPILEKLNSKMMNNTGKLEKTCADWYWSGIDNRYFLVAFIPQNFKGTATDLHYSSKFVYQKDSFFGLFGKKDIDGPQLDISLKGLVEAGKEVVYDSAFYIGPKDVKVLKALPYDLSRSVEIGFFNQFGQYALDLLEWLYGITHNYGWAIVLMTFLVQLILLPLTYKQLKASAVMQKIQPEMKRIQDKYGKTDPMAAQREMMALYKKYGANPLSGCLPLLIQLPIFLALFNALRTSWCLHGAPFILWIKDLSAKDPYYVLPIAMGVMMFIQQKMTMPDMGKDNPNAAMFKWMPIFMTLLFLNFPSGLTLYWFVSNCISLCINVVLKRKLAKAA